MYVCMYRFNALIKRTKAFNCQKYLNFLLGNMVEFRDRADKILWNSKKLTTTQIKCPNESKSLNFMLIKTCLCFWELDSRLLWSEVGILSELKPLKKQAADRTCFSFDVLMVVCVYECMSSLSVCLLAERVLTKTAMWCTHTQPCGLQMEWVALDG